MARASSREAPSARRPAKPATTAGSASKTIVAGAEASASKAAASIALRARRSTLRGRPRRRLKTRRGRHASIIDARNHAYTFHTDPGFSFGEGWYLAAAAALDEGVAVQIEPGKSQTPQAERFLCDCRPECSADFVSPAPTCEQASPGDRGSKPSAPTHSPPSGGSRAAFLGDAPIPRSRSSIGPIGRMASASLKRNKVLLWVRRGAHHPTTEHERPQSSSTSSRRALAARARTRPRRRRRPSTAQRSDGRCGHHALAGRSPSSRAPRCDAAQLQLFEHLKRAHALVGQLGVTTAGMDGPALMGLETMYLTAAPNVRMCEWVGSIPGYQEVVRSEGYLERISDTLRRWAMTRHRE